jgi:hypothetical protein
VLELHVNGAVLEVPEPPVGRTLAETLRDDLGLTGTKVACGEGHCGACTVQLDGVPALSCITLVHTVGEREVTTIEGLRDHPLRLLHAGPDRFGLGTARCESAAEPRRGQTRDGGQPLPLRRLPANRGGSPHVPWPII